LKAFDLYEILERVLGYDIDELPGRLFQLYRGPLYHGDLVSVYQNALVSNPDDIDLVARVSLTPRGRVFIEKVMIDMEYFGGCLSASRCTLQEMVPESAVDYAARMYGELVQPLAVAHMRQWSGEIVPRLGYGEGLPFERYARGLAVGREFYASRVCQSHAAAIRGYVRELMCRRGRGLLVSDVEQEGIERAMEDVPVPADVSGKWGDELVGPVIEGLAEEHVVRRLWRVRSAYVSLSSRLRAVSMMESAEVAELDVDACFAGTVL
jgi:hypothetical protein